MKISSTATLTCFTVLVALLGGCRQGAQQPGPGAGAPAATASPAQAVGDVAPGAAAPPPGGDVSAAAAAPVRDWCGGHGVPESVCTRCNAELIPAFKARGDWCGPHDLPESQCTICNPELIEKFRKMAPGASGPGAAAPPPGGDVSAAAAAPARDWCGGHGVPESECTRCNAELIPAFKARGDWCGAHDLPESQCTICNPELIEKFRKMAPRPPETGKREEPPARRPYEGVRVRLATPETASRAGIATEAVAVSELERSVSAPVRLGFDQTRSARLSSPVAGTLRDLRVVMGTAVRAGDPVLAIASRELAEAAGRLQEAEAALVLAEATLAREERLVARDVSPRKDLLEARRVHQSAQAAVASARGVLAALGASDATGVELPAGAAGRDGRLLVLRAPRAGVVTDLHVAAGQAIEADQILVEIHDPSRLWAELEVTETDATQVRIGVGVTLQFDSLPGRKLAGTITWIAARVDPRTRTVAARAEIANDDGVLRAGMFGRGSLRLEATSAGVTAPAEAVQDAPEGPVAFVQLDRQIFEPRALSLGRASGGRVEILAGLVPGERVVTRGSFLLKTEIMKGSLGAGCCDVVEK